MRDTLEPDVSPRDCALLLAIPLDFASFERAYRDDERDFCRQFTSGCAQQSPRTVWALMFERSMQTIDRLARRVAHRGVTVVRDARLQDWTASLQRFRVVTLVAHWRFTPISEDDILDGPGIKTFAQRRENALAQAIDDVLFDGTSRAEVANALNALCAPAIRRYEARDRKGVSSDRGPSRALLEQHVEGLRHAPAIELADRMYTVHEVLTATPMNYPGVIDLSVCNSILLAEALRRVRSPLVITCGEFRADLAFRMVRYQVLIERLYRRAARYSDLLQLFTRN